MLSPTTEAIKQFKQIQGYMGDRKGQYVDTYAQDMLEKGLHEPELRGELYCQLMKQLTRNDTPESQEQGWALMTLMLSCFPPPTTLENFLAVFLKHTAAPERTEQLIGQMYSIIYAGPRRTPITAGEIPVLVANFYQVRRYAIQYHPCTFSPHEADHGLGMYDMLD